MPFSSDSLKALEIRRRLLTSEAEILRAKLGEEWGEFKASLLPVQGGLKSFRSFFSVASVVATGISALRRLRGTRGALGSRLLAGAGLASTLWMAARARSR